MAQDDQAPGGLLSKVVRFVRNPTVNWSDLDQPEDKESHYSKQMLKEMIERKRANDFVRRREFDQLRKLRQRNALGADAEATGRPSFFQNSLPSDPGDRAGTIKKIDEIEAQMSRQWWKDKPHDATVGEAAAQAAVSLRATEHARQYAKTVHAALPSAQARDTDFAATDIVPMPYAHSGSLDTPMPLDDALELDWPAAPGRPAADAGQDVVHDPALEEAAIRFANGDDAGAEAALSALLEGGGGAATPAHRGIGVALLDLYRATGQRARFDASALAFAARFGASAPPWVGARPAGAAVARVDADADAVAPATPDAPLQWVCPSVLRLPEVWALQAMVDERQPGTHELDWSQLTAIEDDALGPLTALFAGWAGQRTRLQVRGAERLDSLLRRHTVSGERGTSASWWLLRLEWLRIVRRPEAFDLVSLDYCISYEVSPPSWREPACDCVECDDAATTPDPVDAADDRAAGPSALALTGVITGDAADWLATFEPAPEAAGPLLVDCARLLRIDFAAAGAVLNWVVAQHSAGRQVWFTGMHQLVAAFFNVIGVGEHARILSPRH